jgi:branched-chain amino acid transport system ATP-binding protein
VLDAVGPMLAIDDLHCAYGEIQALWGVGFEARASEIVALLGANGAGKTTTLRAVSGLIVPSRGRVRFEGEDITGMPPHEVLGRGISHVPEGRHLWPGMTVLENLEVGAYNRTARAGREERLQWVLSVFPRLAERRAQMAGTLSGGEQQMVAIGRALMGRPRLLLLDEPSLGLAPRIVSEVFEVLGRLRHERMTIVLVEQNAHEALVLADRGYVLENGRVVRAGRAQDLLGDTAVREAYLGI